MFKNPEVNQYITVHTTGGQSFTGGVSESSSGTLTIWRGDYLHRSYTTIPYSQITAVVDHRSPNDLPQIYTVEDHTVRIMEKSGA